MHDQDIFEKFGEFAGIQEFDQTRGSYLGHKEGWGFTVDWLVEEGFTKKEASTMIYKAVKKYENN